MTTEPEGGKTNSHEAPRNRPGARGAWLIPSLGDAVALGALALLAGVRLPDPDLWWHLRAGYDIAAGAGVPRNGWYSWSAPDRPWIDHSWLSELVFAGIHAVAGFDGLALLPAIAVAATLAILWRIQVRDGVGAWTAALVTLLAFFLILPAARPRPYLFTLLLLVVLGLVAVPPWRPWRALAVGALLGLWANLHAGFVIALVWLGLRSLDVLDGARDRAARARYLPWAPVAALLAVGLWIVANPYGIDLLRYPLQYGGGSVHSALIVEWASPTFHDAYGAFLAMWLAATLVAAVGAPRQRRLGDVALAVAFGWLALSAVRHIPVMAVVTAPILGRGLDRARGVVSQWWSAQPLQAVPRADGVATKLRFLAAAAARPRGQAWTAIGLAATLVATIAGTRDAAGDVGPMSGRSVEAADVGPVSGLPMAAADVLIARAAANGGARDALFNDYAWGGYLIWRLAPHGVPVFIDGRADLYGDDIMRDYAAITGLAPGWEARLAEWVDRGDPSAPFLVLMPPESLLPRVLRASCGWAVLHQDEDSVLLQRPEAGVCPAGAP